MSDQCLHSIEYDYGVEINFCSKTTAQSIKLQSLSSHKHFPIKFKH